MVQTLNWQQRLHYRDRLRAARYAALADAEAFTGICFVVEAIGLHVVGAELNMGSYIDKIREISMDSIVLTDMPQRFPGQFSGFDALYRTMQSARNDAMHAGVYARHVTVAAIELCIGLEEAMMQEQQFARTKVRDFMVRDVVTVHAWQPIAYARQLMLMHSFTYLPVKICGQWKLVPETAMAKFLPRGGQARKEALGFSIEQAAQREDEPLQLIEARVILADDEVSGLLDEVNPNVAALWLVDDEHDGLAGILSPFELM
ncbi:hypothetical protein ABH945_007217 [Paraburkholderia sp. GAS333]|uniref:hypothetical protein n=1 Tax=Paraburkholderia sp. GAS333 TaxID=3156279 RepID=UPI003D2571E9